MILRRRSFIFAILALIVAASLQNGGLMVLFGVKPNLILVLFALLALIIERFFAFSIVVLCGILFIGFAPGLNWESGALLLIALLFFYGRSRFLSAGTAPLVLFTGLGTVLFYLLVSPTLLYDETVMVLTETFYNIAIGLILWGLFHFIYETKGRTAIR